MTDADATHQADPDQSLPELLTQLRSMVLSYLHQHTLQPAKGLARFVAFGVAGSMVIGLGLVVVLVGMLRILQVHTGSTFSGNLSWLPYVITAGACFLIAAGAVAAAISRAGRAQ